MQINLSPASVDTFVSEKKWIVEREAKRMWGKMFRVSGTVSYEDVLQEAFRALIVTLHYFNKSQSPMAALDAYLTMGIQSELKNWTMRVQRQFDFTFTEPQMIENIPEVVQDLLPTFEDLEVLSPLSSNAREFLKCVFDPPAELKQKIHARVVSGKPYAKNILPEILSWMKMTYDEFNAIRDELKTKCVYAPLLTIG